MARALYMLAPQKTLRGHYGSVRQLDIHTVNVVFAAQQGPGLHSMIAIKKSDVNSEDRMQVTYNEYLAHQAVYACIESAYSNANVYFTYPFQMTIPCHHVQVNNQAAGPIQYRIDTVDALDTIAPPMLAYDSSEEDVEDDDEQEMLPTLPTWCETEFGYVYTLQSWGCAKGENSKSLFKVYNRLSEQQLRDVGSDVGKALWYMHSCEYVHNDLALRNILVCYTETMARGVLLDFGLARRKPAPLGQDTFWTEMEQSINNIFQLQGGGERWWDDKHKFKERSPFINAAYETYMTWTTRP